MNPVFDALAAVAVFADLFGGHSSAKAKAKKAKKQQQQQQQQTRTTHDSACNAIGAVNFVNTHSADAAKVAASLGVPTENILGLSAEESQWGTGRVAIAANNYFSQHAGPNIPYSIGSIPTLKDGRMSQFASYYDSARSFASKFSGVRGVSDPKDFAQTLVRIGFNSGNAASGGRDDFVPYTTNIINLTKRRMSCSSQ